MTKIQSYIGATLAVLLLCSIALIGYNTYYWRNIAPTRTTVSTAYVGNLKHDENKKYFMEVDYFSNAQNNGEEVLDIRLNYYSDPSKVPEDEEVFKSIYSSGIQFIGTPVFNSIKNIRKKAKTIFKDGISSYHFVPTGDNYYFYNTSNDTSYTAVNEVGIDGNKWIIDFDGTIGLVEQKGFITDDYAYIKSTTNFWSETTRHYQEQDFMCFVSKLYDSVKSLDNGLDVLRFDMSKWFRGYILDESGRKFETLEHGHENWMFVDVKVNKSSHGLISASQSLFKMVKDDPNYSFDGSVLSDYWKSSTIYNLTVNDFDFISHNGSTTDYLARLKPTAINYLWSFNNLDINVIIDLDSKYLTDIVKKLVGFAQNPYGILDIKQTTIKSKTPTIFKVYEQLKNAQLTNVTIETIGGEI